MIKRMRFGIVLGLMILVIDALIPLILAHRVAAMRTTANDAVVVTEQLQTLLSAYQDAETGQRGFMLTGQETFLEPYYQGQRTLAALMLQLQREFTAPQQIQRWQRLLDLSAQERNFQEDRIGIRRRGEPVLVEAAAQGKQLMDGIREQIAALNADEQQRATALLNHVVRLENLSRWSIMLITAVDLVLFVAIYSIAMRSLRLNSETQKALTLTNDKLSAEVVARNDALEQLEWQAGRLNEIVLTQATLMQSQLDTERFLDQVVHKMLKVTSASGAVIEMIEGNDMVYKAVSGAVAGFINLRLRRSGSLSGQCAAENKMLISTDTFDDARVDRATCEKLGVRSMIVVPLQRENETVGVLKIMSGQPNAFGASDIQTVQLMAGFLGSALGHQIQFEKNQALLSERSFTLSKLERELERREQYEKELLSQRQRTDTIIESAHEAYICIDQQGLVQEWNATAANIFGWTKAEVLGKSLTDLIIPDRFREAHNRGIAHFLKTSEGPVLNRRIELPALRRDGQEIPIELTISAVSQGGRMEFPCFLRDISERKQAENALINQHATLRALTDAMPAQVAFVDADEIYRYCNRGYETVFGIAPEKIIGTTLQQFLGDEMYARYDEHFKKALAGQEVVYERTIKSRTQLHHQECRHVPQFDAAGKPSGFYLVAWDVTERKAQEIEWQSRASTDQLTGLMNRAFFLETLNLAVSRSQRADAAMAVFYLDVDRFKHVNDTYGHAAGDTLLKSFAEYLKISVRQSDVVARIGGDEFCIMLDNIRSPENAILVAEKILALVRIPVTHGEHSLTISTSIGIAFATSVNVTGEELIAYADAALYKAKQTGRNRFVLDRVPADSTAH